MLRFKMTIKTFYRATLLLPIVLPMMLLVFSDTWLSMLLLLSLGISGIEYTIFAVLMFCLIGKYQKDQKIRQLFWLSPPIFVLLAILGWHVRLYIDKLFNPSLIFSFGMVLPLLFYGLLIGYTYCVFIELIYIGFRRLDWVKPSDRENNPIETGFVR